MESLDTPGEAMGAQASEALADESKVASITALQASSAHDHELVAPSRAAEAVTSNGSPALRAAPADPLMPNSTQTQPEAPPEAQAEAPPEAQAEALRQAPFEALPEALRQPQAETPTEVPSASQPEARDSAALETKPEETAPLDLRASIAQAGLELVETNKQAQSEPLEAPPKPRVVRQRKPIVKTEEEPLQMVETSRRD
jgi:ribonuclease E